MLTMLAISLATGGLAVFAKKKVDSRVDRQKEEARLAALEAARAEVARKAAAAAAAAKAKKAKEDAAVVSQVNAINAQKILMKGEEEPQNI